jgi:hypothetical protein
MLALGKRKHNDDMDEPVTKKTKHVDTILNISRNKILNVEGSDEEKTIHITPNQTNIIESYDAFNLIRYIDSLHDFSKFFKGAAGLNALQVLFPTDFDNIRSLKLNKNVVPSLTTGFTYYLKQNPVILTKIISQEIDTPQDSTIFKVMNEIHRSPKNLYEFQRYNVHEIHFLEEDTPETIRDKILGLKTKAGSLHFSTIYRFIGKKSIVINYFPIILDLLKEFSLLRPDQDIVGVYDTFKIPKNRLNELMSIKNIISDNIDSATSVSEQLLNDYDIIYDFPIFMPLQKETINEKNPFIIIQITRNREVPYHFVIKFIAYTDIYKEESIESEPFSIHINYFGYEKERVKGYYGNVFKPNRRGGGHGLDDVMNSIHTILENLKNFLKTLYDPDELTDGELKHIQEILVQTLFGLKEIGDKSRLYDVLALNSSPVTNNSETLVSQTKMAYPNVLVSQDSYLVNWAYQLNNIPVLTHTSKKNVGGESTYTLDFFIPGLERSNSDYKTMTDKYNEGNKALVLSRYESIKNELGETHGSLTKLLNSEEFISSNTIILNTLKQIMSMDKQFEANEPERSTRNTLNDISLKIPSELADPFEIKLTQYQYFILKMFIRVYFSYIYYFSIIKNFVSMLYKCNESIKDSGDINILNNFVFLYKSITNDENIDIGSISNIVEYINLMNTFLQFIKSYNNTDDSKKNIIKEMSNILKQHFGIKPSMVQFLNTNTTAEYKQLYPFLNNMIENYNSYNKQIIFLFQNLELYMSRFQTFYTEINQSQLFNINLTFSGDIESIKENYIKTEIKFGDAEMRGAGGGDEEVLEFNYPNKRFTTTILNTIGDFIPTVITFGASKKYLNTILSEDNKDYLLGNINFLRENLFLSESPLVMAGGYKSDSEFITSLTTLDSNKELYGDNKLYNKVKHQLYTEIYNLNESLVDKKGILFNSNIIGEDVIDVLNSILYILKRIENTVIYNYNTETSEIEEVPIGEEALDEYFLKYVNSSRDENSGVYMISDDLFLFYLLNTYNPITTTILHYKQLQKDNNIDKNTIITSNYSELFGEILETMDPLQYMYCPITLMDVYKHMGIPLNEIVLNAINSNWRELTLEYYQTIKSNPEQVNTIKDQKQIISQKNMLETGNDVNQTIQESKLNAFNKHNILDQSQQSQIQQQHQQIQIGGKKYNSLCNRNKRTNRKTKRNNKRGKKRTNRKTKRKY